MRFTLYLTIATTARLVIGGLRVVHTGRPILLVGVVPEIGSMVIMEEPDGIEGISIGVEKLESVTTAGGWDTLVLIAGVPDEMIKRCRMSKHNGRYMCMRKLTSGEGLGLLRLHRNNL